RRHFTHSKVMAWVAFDRAISTAELYERDVPPIPCRGPRPRSPAGGGRKGSAPGGTPSSRTTDPARPAPTRLGRPPSASLPRPDPRSGGTVRAIERELMSDGFVMRYAPGPSSEATDGLPAGEGVFLPCTLWLADNYALQGRDDEARRTFERVLKVANDVGLISEEYDPRAGRLLGNFPQAFSHVSIVNTARNLSHPGGPATDRHESAK